MTRFDTVLVVDWSGGKDRGATPKADAIWTCVARDGVVEPPVYHRNRQVAEAALREFLEAELRAGRRVLAGFDFAFGYPAGFAEALTGRADALGLWDWVEARITDAPEDNNRFDLAGEINARFPGDGPFWGNGLKREIAGLRRGTKGLDRAATGLAERRQVETQVPGAFSCWQLAGAGAVGSQTLMGLPVLARLRRALAGRVAVWPFEPVTEADVVLAEVYPSILSNQVSAAMAKDPASFKDAVQVEVLARALSRLAARDGLGPLFAAAPSGAHVEGWVLGAGAEAQLRQAAQDDSPLRPPPLRNDCFALPQGVLWTPVAEALDALRARIRPVTGTERLPLSNALGRVLAERAIARRANPPGANSAVDGYGFAGASIGAGPQVLPLVNGRAAAGAPYRGRVPKGHAIRILTGALLPEGVDTVVLEEDCSLGGGQVAFEGPVKPGANARKAGEDVQAGAEILAAGRRLGPPELALLAATGLAEVAVHRPLRVGVISTGDELVAPGQDMDPGKTFDANRPMLLGLIADWGLEAVDLGQVADTRDAVRAALDGAAAQVDAVLTSGGASAGDEDHVSALLRAEGHLQTWRVAMKPGRPLALALWQGVPVVGLPGNPVAAFVCSLVFARPMLAALSGQDWPAPQGFTVPAAFSKRKKAGRREYLRARLNANGRAEVFASEGSGRVSGLSWASGLVELDEDAREISPGDPVRFVPYVSFGVRGG
ncbi:gephyrin-like molybdotransferase Glp [Fluviibacterium sp. DFM31]|uniref:Molybdopterin molybdenumtransferase n=1 Tax=Meridianimarinicoccus marinus TaxID=3231483 RepID=A0ABV3L2B7_9RHOB